MAITPNMDEAQISFLANEMTKSYMDGKNMGPFQGYAEEYMEHFVEAITIIRRLQQVNTKENPEDYDVAVGYTPNNAQQNVIPNEYDIAAGYIPNKPHSR